MPKLPSWMLQPQTRLDWAIYWTRRGYPVLPLNGKDPMIKDGVNAATLDEAQARTWWTRWPEANIGGRLDGRLGFDIDLKNGGSWDQVADLTGGSRHLSGRGDGGGHLIYTLTPEQMLQVKGVRQSKYADGVDIRIDTRGYIVLPPSVHPEGKQQAYTIESDRDEALPQAAWERLLGRNRDKVAKGEAKVGEGGAVRSMLVNLLANVPTRGKGEANGWLTAVCGHYAKQYAKQEDLYLLHAREAAGKLNPALEDAEKAIASIWRTEQAKHADIEAAVDTNGWLIGDGRRLLCPVKVKQGEEYVLRQDLWADFDLQAQGVVLADEEKAAEWVVALTRARDGVTIDTTIGADVLADSRKLAAWCAVWRVGITPPERGQTGRGSAGTRILRYLEAQRPSQFRRVTHLGWDEQAGGSGGFVTHDSVIRADEVLTLDQAGLRPAAKLTNDAQYHYGFNQTRQDALAVLDEVLTFQEETVASVFGSWWALCLVKGQLMKYLSQFPLCALEATSESGKTTGFFDLMLQLAGSRHRPGMPTYPVLRDRIGASRSGIVWMDDRDDLEPYFELFRAASTEETVSKKAENRTDTVDFPMVAPILLSGEALGIGEQKALVDRFIRIELGAGIKQRRSVRPGREQALQWADVIELRERYPDGLGGLSVVAGWLVQEALTHADEVIGTIKTLQTGSGRWGDAMTLIRLGARLLDAMLSDVTSGATTHAQRCDQWVAAQTDPGDENTLTKLLLPTALRVYGEPDCAEFEPLGRGTVTTPAFVDKDSGVVRYSTVLLAEWWSRHRHGRVRLRTETAEALQSQAARLAGDAGGAVRIRNAPGRSTQRYRTLSVELSRVVLARARGGVPEDGLVVTEGGVTTPMPLSLQPSVRQKDIDKGLW